MSRKTKPCAWCEGTGRYPVARSWFPADGYSHIRCGICSGSGLSNFPADKQHRLHLKRYHEHKEAVRASKSARQGEAA